MSEQPTLKVKVHSPYRVYFNDNAFSISAVNDTGPFDVLPRHHKFVTLLNACEIVVRAPTGEQKIRISRGLMHVRDDNVAVFLDV